MTPRDQAAPPTAGPPAPRAWWFGALAGVTLVGLGLALVWVFLPRFLDTPSAPGDAAPVRPTASAGQPSAVQRTIVATLFYLSPGRLELVPVAREVPFGETPLEQARRIAEAQVGPPPDGQVSTIPAGTTVRGLYLTDGRAYVDLGGPIVTGHAGGTLAEALTVYAIVNALTVNLPDVSAVQILVDGKEVDTLTGHLDLRSPLGRSTRWVQQPRGQ